MGDPQILKDLVKNNFPIEDGCAEERGASSRETCATSRRHILQTLFFLRKLFFTDS
jgi:hypothetical protein